MDSRRYVVCKHVLSALLDYLFLGLDPRLDPRRRIDQLHVIDVVLVPEILEHLLMASKSCRKLGKRCILVAPAQGQDSFLYSKLLLPTRDKVVAVREQHQRVVVNPEHFEFAGEAAVDEATADDGSRPIRVDDRQIEPFPDLTHLGVVVYLLEIVVSIPIAQILIKTNGHILELLAVEALVSVAQFPPTRGLQVEEGVNRWVLVEDELRVVDKPGHDEVIDVVGV